MRRLTAHRLTVAVITALLACIAGIGVDTTPSPRPAKKPSSRALLLLAISAIWPRVGPLALRVLAAGALLVFVGLLVPTDQAQGQTVTTLVSNLSQGNDTRTDFSEPTDVAQQFTTGSAAGSKTARRCQVRARRAPC